MELKKNLILILVNYGVEQKIVKWFHHLVLIEFILFFNGTFPLGFFYSSHTNENGIYFFSLIIVKSNGFNGYEVRV